MNSRSKPIQARRRSMLGLTATLLLAACSSPRPPSSRSAPDGGLIGTSEDDAWRSTLPEPLAREVVLRTMSLVDTPYRRGGNTPDTGFDCSGLIGFVFRDAAGLTLPRTVSQLAGIGHPVPRAEIRSADLVFFDASGPLSHAGIYVGGGRFAHAPSTGGRVRLERLSTRYWSSRLVAVRRV